MTYIFVLSRETTKLKEEKNMNYSQGAAKANAVRKRRSLIFNFVFSLVRTNLLLSSDCDAGESMNGIRQA